MGKLILMCVVAPVLLITGFVVAYRGTMLFGYPFWFLVSFIWAGPIAEMIIRPFLGFLLPSHRYDKPQPMYSVPEALRKQNKIDESFQAYQQMSREFPQEVKPWVEMVRLAHLEFQKEDLTKEVYQNGMKQLSAKPRREELRNAYEAILSMRQNPAKSTDRRSVPYRS